MAIRVEKITSKECVELGGIQRFCTNYYKAQLSHEKHNSSRILTQRKNPLPKNETLWVLERPVIFTLIKTTISFFRILN